MKKQIIIFTVLLFLLSPSMLFSGIFDNPIAAKIIHERGVNVIYFFCRNILETGDKEAHDAIFNNKSDFECALEKNKFISLRKEITSKAELLKTETDEILKKGVDSFVGGFVPTTFFHEIKKNQLAETLFLGVKQQPHLSTEKRTTGNNNFADSELGGGDQLKNIIADFNQKIEKFGEKLKNHEDKIGSIVLPPDSSSQSQHPQRRLSLIDQRKTKHDHGGLTKSPSLDNAPTTGEMLYMEDDKLPYNTSADPSEKLKVVKLGKNVTGFSRGDTNTTTPNTIKPSQTTSGKTLGSSRENDPDIEMEQPSDEQRKIDREKFWARFKKD